MDPLVRFEILQQIAQGDFAMIFRARDRELGREVAIKQIHPQFLRDPRQLDRYWQEAQILASLEHPHIVRIYDLVRDRGWLVLELMQGSLQQLLNGRPIDLNDLRMTMTYTAHALQFIHARHIVHGDVKPSNLLVDRNQRVKLGDFGIARRIHGDHGSVVKGTTRYMAPEVVSDQFGPVGPHSDLYSLGFSAYELLCGANFDSLFPGLNMYGRDQQVAWMMWHAALDRRLPEIQRVLEGVPPDLAYVIEKLVEKDPSKRYRTADEVLADLRSGTTGPVGPSEEQLAAVEADERRKTRRKQLAIVACVVSIGLSVGLYLLPSPTGRQTPAAPAAQRPTAGRIGEIDAERGMVFVQPDEGSTPFGLEFHAERDRVFINDQRGTLADLRRGERVEIRYLTGAGVELIELTVNRAAESTLESVIESIDPAKATLDLIAAGGVAAGRAIYVPDSVTISLNRQTAVMGRPLRLADLKVGDRVAVGCVPSEDGRLVATTVDALRAVTWNGVVIGRPSGRGPLEIRLTAASAEPGSPGSGATRKFELAADCRFTINGQEKLGDVPATAADLQTGDDVRLEADAEVHVVVATREQRLRGTVTAVDATARQLSVTRAGGTMAQALQLGPQTLIRLGAGGPQVELSFLRAGDVAEVELSLGADAQGNRLVDMVQVTPAPDLRGWAVIISQQHFDDQKLPSLKQTDVDAQRVANALRLQYRMPESQVLLLTDVSRLRLQQDLPAFLAKIPAESQLICFYTGWAFLDPAGTPILAVKELDTERIGETGAPLRWLVDQLGTAAAREKILVLDASPANPAAGGPTIRSTYELVEALRPKPQRPVSANVLVLGSCSKGQYSRSAGEGKPSFFAEAVAAALGGAGDANHDQRVSSAELVEYTVRETAALAGNDNPQQPVAWLPEQRPERLTKPAREAVLKFLAQTRASRLDEDLPANFQSAQTLTPNLPDISLAYALALLKHNRTPLSRPLFERVRADHPDSAVAHQALAWQSFLQGKLIDGLSDLRQLVTVLPDPALRPETAPLFQQALELAGVMREFALRAAEPAVEPAAVRTLDQAVVARGESAKAAYQKGIDAVRDGLKRVDEDIESATDPAKKRALQLDRRRLTYYTSFNFGVIADYLRQLAEE